MFSHFVFGVTDLDRAFRFYEPVMQALKLKLRFIDKKKPWAAWQSAGDSRPLFIIRCPYNDEPHQAGNGQMIAFSAESRKQVKDVYEIALMHGGSSEGIPGLRQEYHPDYYGAYFRDPDGNKICVVCHTVEKI